MLDALGTAVALAAFVGRLAFVHDVALARATRSCEHQRRQPRDWGNRPT